MERRRAIAIVGVGAILPDAPNAATFWDNVKTGRYSISEVTADRWDAHLFYDPDPSAPDKTYSKIGGWVREYSWDPLKWHLPIPPKVAAAMDGTQRWAVACTRQALEDYGYPQRKLDPERTAVIVGNAMAGEMHYLTAIRAYMPQCANELADSAAFAQLPELDRKKILEEFQCRMGQKLPEITEDTMPGELSNCIAGRIANLFNFHGPNYVVDAACASAMAAISSAVEGLEANEFDLAVSGGIDRNMGPSTFIKFCKIGALSATGSRPYAEGADGFVMGEGGVILLLKRLADAERDQDNIYAVLRGIGGSSDGRGKGITAPNPIGQKLAIERAWQNAGLSPATATLIEGHGTSTKVGDVVEVQSLIDVLSDHKLQPKTLALGSVKSNIGHLKAAAGAAGLLKTIFALRDKVLPPSVSFERPNPDIDFAHSPLYVNTELKEWSEPGGQPRRAGVSAFGFGGTNFHTVLEEYVPGQLHSDSRRTVTVPVTLPESYHATMATGARQESSSCKLPLRGALLLGAENEAQLVSKLRIVMKSAEAGIAPEVALPTDEDLRAAERLAIDYGDPAELATKAARALKAIEDGKPSAWRALSLKGVFRGQGAAQKIAFLFTGQGSQYVNMLWPFRAADPIVAKTFEEADEVLTPLLGKPLSHYIFFDAEDPKAIAKAEEDLRQTAITQPAVLTTDIALRNMLAAYGVEPDMTMGHSLGEYGALVASGALTFRDALEAVSARGREMTRVSVADNGRMAAVSGPIDEIEKVLQAIKGYVVIANINSDHQAVIGGATQAVEQAMEDLQKAGFACVGLQVSHAFHTSIVAPASEPLRSLLERLDVRPPRIPVVANVTGEFYPSGPGVERAVIELLSRQVASPVQFVKGLNTLYDAGARVFLEVGPKKALHSFAEDVLLDRGDVVALYTNHPKIGEVTSFNQALCGLYAAGHGRTQPKDSAEVAMTNRGSGAGTSELKTFGEKNEKEMARIGADRYHELGKLFADVLESGWKIYHEGDAPQPQSEPVVITGAGLGLPGTDRIFDDTNVERILRGDQFIDAIPMRFRQAMLEKNITRLVKSETGGPTFETIRDMGDVIKLAGRGGAFDAEKEFGLSSERIAALDRVTQLAIGAGIEAMRDAGIPLVLRYKKTTKGTLLPDRWGLPDCMRDDTGVIFGSAFPGYDSLVDQVSRYYIDKARRDELTRLQRLLVRAMEVNSPRTIVDELQHRIDDVHAALDREGYVFDRRFLFRTLSMGHSQFAEFIGARGPNTAINSACATTTQAISLAEDWIQRGRCKRVIIVSADDVTSDNMMEWIGAGFLASGAAATDEVVEDAAIPFDKRRHGLVVGMGAAALVVEGGEAARERGIRPICELLSSVTANSAFHGTRLDVQHISDIMEKLIAEAEQKAHVGRHAIAPRTMFMSHETYTPARGGSASAEINALRRVFGQDADRIVIANTKGFTGHAMGAGVEDVVALKALETGCVPPVPNFKEVDPELGNLTLSSGGMYPVEYALRLAAGFGSQISMTLTRWVPSNDGTRPHASKLGYAYRIADTERWNEWLKLACGRANPTLEVVSRTLRIRDERATSSVSPTAVENVEPQPKMHESVHITLDATKPSIAASSLSEPKPATTAVAPQESALRTQSEPVAQAGRETAVKESVLKLVSEKTGYPPDMLDLDLDLEADLGIDTVKQAEVFAAIRAMYNIPRDDKRKLRDYPTLAHVIRFVLENGERGTTLSELDTKSVAAVLPELLKTTQTLATNTDEDPVKEKLLEIVVQKTGYPKEMLDLDLDLEADLGIDTVKQAELFAAVREMYNIPRDEKRKLRDYPTLAHVIRFVHEQRPDPAREQTPPKTASTPGAVNSPAPRMTAAAEMIEAHKDTEDSVKDTVLRIVSEKTGYPSDMLDLGLDLEADLGIDTVKQAEMFAAVRAEFDIPRDEHLKLRDFPTLEHVIRFAQDRRKRVSKATESKQATEAEVPKQKRSVAAPASFDAANLIPRRVPIPIPRPPLSLCKRTGVELKAGSRVMIMPDAGGVAEELEGQLRQKGADVLVVRNTPDVQWLTAQVKTWINSGRIQGVFWLPALDVEPDLTDMTEASWHEAVRVRVKSLYLIMKALYEQIAASGTFLVTATRMGGQHGYDEAGAMAPIGGAVAGFTKAYKREHPETTCKIVDFEAGIAASEVSENIISEALFDTGAVEIGYKNGQRWTIGLREIAAEDGKPGLTLDSNSVFLVTGAAGSIVSAITADLAIASGGTFYLLDLVAKPDPDDSDLKRFLTDREALKRDLFNRTQARGERATPALVEKELTSLERACAAQSAIDAVRIAGGTAHYFSVDLRDGDAVADVVSNIREQSGRIDVLLHGAGIERSHFLPDKVPNEFDLVFDVKCDGWFNLIRAIGTMPVGATVVFSSVAGRFGNAGQTDYSAANDLLCKMTSHLRKSRPDTRAIAIDWTAWGGIGMATRGSIPKMMEVAGIDMLPPEAGIPLIRRELTVGATQGELVIGQRLGVLGEEWDPAGGLDANAVAKMATGPMIGNVITLGMNGELRLETMLDPAQQPFLHDHRIEGTPILPGVMGIEAFAEAATAVLPEWTIDAVEDVTFSAPFKFYRDEARLVTVLATLAAEGDDIVAECRLTGSRKLPNGVEPKETIYFTGRVRLTKRPPQVLAREAPKDIGTALGSEDIYRIYFHGPAYQVLKRVWIMGKQMRGLMATGLSANHHPQHLTTKMAPREIELCFQTASLWQMSVDKVMGLPQHVEAVRLYKQPDAAREMYAIVSRRSDGAFDVEVVDEAGSVYLQLEGYRTIAMPTAADLECLQRLYTEPVTEAMASD
jgi:acyl transferase domain-containing protein/NAD(P)-dependent dehydrogenase (short-subunit alcohol dehydrogenase family)/acyl carrier protein